MNLKGKPSVEDILTLYTKCSEIYQPLFEQFQADEKYYELDFQELLSMPEEFKSKGVVLPTARDMVDVCVDHTDISNARVFVNRKGTNNTSEAEQEMMRKFYLGLIHRTNVESSISPWRVGAKHFWMHGLTAFKTVWDADLYPDKPEQKKGQSDNDYAVMIDEWRSKTQFSIPIVIKAVNPRSLMPDPYEGGGRFMFEVTEKLVYDVKQKYPKWSNPEGRTINDKVTAISFWTPQYRCELYDKEPILKLGDGVVKHNYGIIPYVLIDTGLGNVAYDNDPKKRYVGILRYIRDLLVSESRNYSISDVVLAKTAYPWFTLEGDNAERVVELTQKFGEVNKLPPGTKVVPQISQVPPQALNDHLYRTASYIAGHAAPNSVRGMGEQGVRSGADRRLLIAEASARYQYSTEAFKNGTAKVLANCALIMKNVIPGDIRVWARTPTDEFDVEIKKDKMTEPFTCYVEFAPISEEDEYRRHDDLERLAQSGLVTRKWARTQMSNVDPMAMELEEEVQRLSADPQLQQIVTQYAAGKLMEVLSKRSAAESATNPPPAVPPVVNQGANVSQQGQAPPTVVNRQMIPPIPAVPPLGSAQDLQNKMKQQRSQTPISPTQGRGINAGGNK